MAGGGCRRAVYRPATVGLLEIETALSNHRMARFSRVLREDQECKRAHLRGASVETIAEYGVIRVNQAPSSQTQCRRTCIGRY